MFIIIMALVYFTLKENVLFEANMNNIDDSPRFNFISLDNGKLLMWTSSVPSFVQMFFFDSFFFF